MSAVRRRRAELQRRRLADGPLTIELSEDELLEDLCWPGPPPGRWDVEQPIASRRRPWPRRAA